MNIAILGLGTIGSGVYELLKDNKDIFVKRILDLRCWMDNMTTDIDDIVNDAEIETVVEAMGGLHPVREYALKCLKAGKNYVTANKLLMSECAKELQAAADESSAALMFSASCGGGIPYLYNLQKTAKTDKITDVGGILNGTTNFMLDKVFMDDADYAAALNEAQRLGYAEKDPSSDVDGLDTMRKLMLSCAVAFGTLPEKASMPCHGISKLNEADISYAKERGSVIRLTAAAHSDENGKLDAYVIPKLCASGSVESSIRLNVNYAWYMGERIGLFGFSGQGAGKFPTANNIIRDIYAISQGDMRMFPEGFEIKGADNLASHRFYLRMPKGSGHGDIANNVIDAGEYEIIETKAVTFNQLNKVIDGESDYFTMLLED